MAAAGAGAVTAALVVSPAVRIAGFASALAGFGLAQRALVDRVSRSSPPEQRGIAVGLFNLGFFPGGAVGSALVGSLGLRDGSMAVALLAVASGSLLARPHDTPDERCIRSIGTLAGAVHCLTAGSRPPRTTGAR